MLKQITNTRERAPTPPSLLIAAHCSTIRRKGKYLDTRELSAILDDLVRELNVRTLRFPTYINSLNEIVKILNSTLPPTLLGISSHYFFIIIRNTIRNFLQQISVTKKLPDQDVYILRNCVLLLHHIAEKINDISKILHWITDATFLDSLANCLDRIDKICKKDQNNHIIKQIARLLNMFCIIQERLPLDLHSTLFVRLLQPTINCLTSSTYVILFENLKPNANSFTEIQKLYLIKCPYFLTTYNGPHIEKAIGQILEIMLPRYVSILDKHIKKIKQWNRPIMRAIHNLIITIVYAEGYFSSHITSQSFRSLIKHLLYILNESTLIKKIHPNSNNMETLLIDATLVVFNVLIYESDALDYIKQCKPIDTFRQLTTTPYETIVLNAYMMLAYTIDDNEIKTSQADLIQLFSTTFNLLKTTIDTREKVNVNRENIDRNILQLVETLKGLAQYEQIRNEILKQGIVPVLIDYYQKVHGLSKQILLECLWKLSFNKRIAQQLREHSQFIALLEDIPTPVNDNTPQNTIRRSNSYSNLRSSTVTVLAEATNSGIQKAADGLLWKVVKEYLHREKMQKQTEINVGSDRRKYKYDIMISYCYADKDIVYKIQHFLADEGYSIWFDREHHNGQAMEIVAEAIGSSEFVIICMSDSYKRDEHCQAQAEYALIAKRLLIPLIVHHGYRPDGWLTSIITDSIYIDFATLYFSTASELLLKEIKQRQHNNNILDVRPTVSTPVSIVQSSSVPWSVSDIPVESYTLNGASGSTTSSFPSVIFGDEQQMPTRPITRPPTFGADIFATPGLNDRKQQEPMHSTSRPATPGSIITAAAVQQQQSAAPVHSISRPSTPGTAPSNTSTTIIQQRQVPVHSVSRPLTPGTIASGSSGVDNKQQQQTTTYSVSRSSTSSTISSDASVDIEKKQQQQQSVHPATRSLTNGTASSSASVAVDKEQQQQTQMHLASRSRTPSSASFSGSDNGDKQQQQKRSIHPVSQTSMANVVFPAKSGVVLQQQQQTSTYSPSQPLINGVTPSAASVIVDRQLQKASLHSISAPSTINAIPSAAYVVSNGQERAPVQSNLKATTSDPIRSVAFAADNKQQALTHSTLRPSIHEFIASTTSANIHKQQRQNSVHSTSKSLISVPGPSAISVATEKQQQQQIQSRSNSRSTTPASGISDTSAGVGKQQQQQRVPSRSNSRPTTPAGLPVVLPRNSVIPTPSQTNGQEQSRVPGEYTNRKTNNSIYRTISINAWRNNDVLDFLFDSNLYVMMPLCESMSGKALVRLFRMCQRKPSRLYDQLNEELRVRFKGLTLPMGAYTQFLIEMDALVGPVPDALPPVLNSIPKVVERVIYMPRTSPQQQVTAIQPSPRPSIRSITSVNRSKNGTPVEIPSGATTPRGTRIVERAVYRPASNVGRPYNFIVESVEESTALLEQVQRYGNQLLLLDETARQHREMNSFR